MIEFIDAVRRFFEPLARLHGLSCISSEPEFIRFANASVFLQIRYSASWSYEIGVEIGKIPTSINQTETPPLNLSEVLRSYDVPEATYVERLQVSKPEVISAAIERLAALTGKYAAGILEGNDADYLRIEQYRVKQGAEYALSRDLKYARESAEKAWEAKNYSAFVKAYKPFANELSVAERKRLEFAEKKLQCF